MSESGIGSIPGFNEISAQVVSDRETLFNDTSNFRPFNSLTIELWNGSLVALLMQLKPLSRDNKLEIIKAVIEKLSIEECEEIKTIGIIAIPKVLKIILSHLKPEQMDKLLHNGMKEDLFMAIKKDVTVLESVSDRIKGDREIVIVAVKQNGWALEFASEELKGAREIVMVAVKQNGWALEFASDELRRDREVVMEAVKRKGYALQWALEELKGDREIVMEAVKQDGLALVSASEELKGDREIVMEAVKQNGDALYYASAELKRDSEIVMEAAKQCGFALPEGLKSDHGLVMGIFHGAPETDDMRCENPTQGESLAKIQKRR